MRRRVALLLGLNLLVSTAAGQSQSLIPPGYPAAYAEIVAMANAKGTLSILANTDANELSDLLSQFRALYPKLKVEYTDRNSADLYKAYLADAATGQTADLIWSSAMDLQVKLVNDGYALSYSSPEKASLPAWVKWRDQAYGTTAEPIVFAYNGRFLNDGQVPDSHGAFAHIVTRDSGRFDGKVASYDPERSSLGFLYASQDVQVSPTVTWETIRAIGRTAPRFHTSTDTILDGLVSGEHLLAYNVIGSHVIRRSRSEPDLRYVLPKDYTHVMSRIAFISTRASNPEAAKLFLDFLLSRTGQIELAKRSMMSIRTDLELSHGLATLPGAAGVTLKPIRVGPELLTYLDQSKRSRFLKLWRSNLGK